MSNPQQTELAETLTSLRQIITLHPATTRELHDAQPGYPTSTRPEAGGRTASPTSPQERSVLHPTPGARALDQYNKHLRTAMGSIRAALVISQTVTAVTDVKQLRDLADPNCALHDRYDIAQGTYHKPTRWLEHPTFGNMFVCEFVREFVRRYERWPTHGELEFYNVRGKWPKRNALSEYAGEGSAS